MIHAKEIAYTCYPVSQVARSREFYEGTLGLKPTMVFGEGDKQWIEYDIGAGTVAIGHFGDDWTAGKSGGSVTLEVDDFAAAVAHLKSNAVRFYHEPFETPVCHMAFFSDPDGNGIGIHQRKVQQG